MTRDRALSPLPDWNTLSLPQQVAQLMVVRASGYGFDGERRYPQWEASTDQLQYWIEELGIGGVILLGGSAIDVAARIQQLQAWSRIPLLCAADIEEGVGRRFAGATWLPPPLALGEIAKTDLDLACHYAHQMGAITAQEAQAIGLNWILAPVVDVNNNSRNPVINVRAFGEQPETVIPLIESFIQGTQGYSVLTAAKHFPGHGDTATDSHLDLPCIPHSRSRLDQVELAPFRAAIAAGVDAVMTAHLRVPGLDPELPASLSALTLTQLLRQELGHKGLIVTDALVMQAITKYYGDREAPVMALAAGSDIILMPVHPETAIAAICEAVAAGRIPIAHIHRSLDRLWRVKRRLSRSASPPESRPPVPAIAQPAATAICDDILQRSQKVQIPTGELPNPSPLGGHELASSPVSSPPTNLILVDNLLGDTYLGMHTPAVQQPQAWGYQLRWLDRHVPAIAPLAPTPTLLQLFIRANPFQDTAGLVLQAQDLIQTLGDRGQLQGVILYGSPYVWQQLQSLCPPHIPAVFTYGQMPQAQAIALAKLLSLGLPVAGDVAAHSGSFTT